MKNKYNINLLFCVLGFLLFNVSCSNDQEQSKSTTESEQSSSKAEVSQVAESGTSLLEKQLAKDSLNIEIRLKLASTLYALQDFEKALFHYKIITNIDSKNVTALINIGNIFYDTKQFPKAIEYYEKAIPFDKQNINMRCDLATCYFNLKDTEKAIKILIENTKTDINHAQTHYNLSVIYNSIGKKQEANMEMEIFKKLKQ